MIKDLYVKNLAIIEDIHLEFSNGMTVLTGQTGAGKSLIIDSVGLLLGARADADLIRYNEEKAVVCGVFDYNNPKINLLLEKYGINCNGFLEIKREISISGKNSIKVNNTNVSLNQLKEISSFLADIHTQNDSLRLINPDNYLNIIDGFEPDKINKFFNEYQIDYWNYKESYDKYQKALKSNNDANEKMDLYKFQFEEITTLNLVKDEDISLKESISKLENYDKIYNGLNETYELLANKIVDNVYDSFGTLSKISSFSSDYEEKTQTIKDAYYNLDDVKASLKREIDSLDFDPSLLDSLLIREQEINRLEKKYKKTVNELIDYQVFLSNEIKMHEDYDGYLKDCLDEIMIKHKKLCLSSDMLLKERKKIACNIEKLLMDESLSLDLKNTIFKIDFKENNINDYLNIEAFTKNGTATVDFLITLNLGEPLKPLAKVASGGEMSRIMLGFKSIIASKQKLSLMVFDEIDSGISGVTASKIAKKIYGISRYSQVLCITHLPQVASISDTFIHITKVLENKRTKTETKILNEDDKIREIAIMLSGERVSESALLTARELIKNSKANY